MKNINEYINERLHNTLKPLYKKDENLFKSWAKEFIKQYPNENDWLKCPSRFDWLCNRAAKDGYRLAYDDAEYDFMDLVFEINK